MGKVFEMNRKVTGLLCCAALAWGCSSSSDGPQRESDAGDVDAAPGDGGADGAMPDGSATDGGAGDGGGGDGGEGDATPDAMTCGASPFEADRIPVNLLLVVDKSGSMDNIPEGFSTDKWTALTEALEASLMDVQDDLTFGAELYPVGGSVEAACDVPSAGPITVGVGQGAAHVSEVVSKLVETTPGGATPTAAALDRALEFFTSGEGSSLEGDRYVLLATDGGPNCNGELSCGASECTYNLEGQCNFDGIDNCCDATQTGDPDAQQYCLDDDASLAAMQALANAGIPTVVVGIPGSEAFADTLDALAVAGGMPSAGSRDYFEVTADGSGAGSLSDVLSRVTRQLIRTCELQLGSTPPDINKLNVEVDGEIIPRDDPDGWSLETSTDPPTIILEGDLCDQVETDGASSVDVTFGCPTITII